MTRRPKPKMPPRYDEKKLRHVYYAPGYTGWVIDCGDGTCRYANDPLLGADFGFTRIDDDDLGSRLLTEKECLEINRNRPRYGDRVRMAGGNPDPKQIIERWTKKQKVRR